jgi:hypothetical protein
MHTERKNDKKPWWELVEAHWAKTFLSVTIQEDVFHAALVHPTAAGTSHPLLAIITIAPITKCTLTVLIS